jgi:hypothetical protein
MLSHCPDRDLSRELAATVLHVLDTWMTVARWADTGALVVWSPKLSELQDRVDRLQFLRQRTHSRSVRSYADTELHRLRTERVLEAGRLIQERLDSDPLLLISCPKSSR